MTTQTKQMSPVDSAWLHMEEPTNLMMITGVSLLDTLPDFERFRKTLEVRLLTLDRFHGESTNLTQYLDSSRTLKAKSACFTGASRG